MSAHVGELLALQPDAPHEVTTVQGEGELALQLRSMAGMLGAMHAEIVALRQQIDGMATLTPAQEATLQARIRARGDLLAAKRLGTPALSGKVSGLIRRDLRRIAGVRAMRDVPRCRYADYLRYVDGWDDRTAVTGLREP